MFEQSSSAAGAVAHLTAAVDELLELDMTALTGDDVLDVLRGAEQQRRRLASLDHALIARAERLGVAGEHGCRSTADALGAVLRIDPAEAFARVRAAAQLGPRVSLTGERLAPAFPALAAAQRTGDISAAAARVITRTIDALPATVAVEHGTAVEEFLIEQAAVHNPRTVQLIARRLRDTLDPDGTLTTAADRQRRRELSVYQRPDGSSRVGGELDAMCTEALLTVLDTLARPAPADDGAKDPRTPGQRRHDGLKAGLLTLLRSGQLPDCGGVSTSIVLTLTAEQLAAERSTRGAGFATSGHGALIPVREALSMMGSAQIQSVVLDKVKGITAYSHTRRIFTQQQRFAMIVRDHGCSFPGCTVPATWCEAHHIVAWADGGLTSVDNGALLCGYHHREHERLGWSGTMINGRPHWIPPPWIDPERVPRANDAHVPSAV